MREVRIVNEAVSGDAEAQSELVAWARRRRDVAPLVEVCERMESRRGGGPVKLLTRLDSAGDAGLFDALFRASALVREVVLEDRRRWAWRFECAVLRTYWQKRPPTSDLMTLEALARRLRKRSVDWGLDLNRDAVLRVHAPELGEPDETKPLVANALPAEEGALGAYAAQIAKAVERLVAGRPALITWPMLGGPRDIGIALRGLEPEGEASPDSATVGEVVGDLDEETGALELERWPSQVEVVGLQGRFAFFDRPYDLGADLAELSMRKVHKALDRGWLAPVIQGEEKKVRHTRNRWCRRACQCVFPGTWLAVSMHRAVRQIEVLYDLHGSRPELTWFRGPMPNQDC